MLTSKSKKSVKEPTDQLIVALDIGTVNAKALIVRLTNKGLEVLGSGRAGQDIYDMQAGAIADISAVITNCGRALVQAERQAGQRPARAVLGIAGELIRGVTNRTRVHRANSSYPLDFAEIDAIIVETQAEAKKQAQKEIALEFGGQTVDLKLINSALIGITIDNYKVTNPIGFQGGVLETQLYTAFAPLVHTSAIERVAAGLGLDLIAIAAEPFAMARSVIGDDINVSLNAILIDIGGGTTDIAVLREGSLEATKTFAVAGNSFTKAIARHLSVSYHQAEEIKLAYSLNDHQQLSAADYRRVQQAINQTAEIWLTGIKMSFSEISWLEYLPHQIYLLGGGSALGVIREQLTRPHSSWYRQLPFLQKPSIKFIKPSDIPDIEDPKQLITDHTLIVGLGLGRVGRDTLQTDLDSQQSMIKQTRQKFNQVLSN